MRTGKTAIPSFTEIKPREQFSVIGRYDRFDPNTDAKDDENNRIYCRSRISSRQAAQEHDCLDYDTVNYRESDRKDDKRNSAHSAGSFVTDIFHFLVPTTKRF